MEPLLSTLTPGDGQPVGRYKFESRPLGSTIAYFSRGIHIYLPARILLRFLHINHGFTLQRSKRIPGQRRHPGEIGSSSCECWHRLSQTRKSVQMALGSAPQMTRSTGHIALWMFVFVSRSMEVREACHLIIGVGTGGAGGTMAPPLFWVGGQQC